MPIRRITQRHTLHGSVVSVQTNGPYQIPFSQVLPPDVSAYKLERLCPRIQSRPGLQTIPVGATREHYPHRQSNVQVLEGRLEPGS